MSKKIGRTLIIPAAGTASRLRGFPKFLLPTHTNNVTLLERHISYLQNHFDEILIGINPDFTKILKAIISENNKVKIYEMTTKTMMETVNLLTKKSSNENFMLIMPDTYFSDYRDIVAFLNQEKLDEATLLCWRIKEYQMGKLGQVYVDQSNHVVEIQDKNPLSKYEFFWGATLFSAKHLLTAIDSDPHIGFLYERLIKQEVIVHGLMIQGDYYDCGTQEEYIEMLLKTR